VQSAIREKRVDEDWIIFSLRPRTILRFSNAIAAPKPKGLYDTAAGFQPISAKIIVRHFDARMAFVPEGQLIVARHEVPG
jgi:hypothetical protein